MINDNKEFKEYKKIKKWLLIGMAIIVVILIFYFNLTSEPPLTSNSSKITPLNKKTYKFWNLLSILTGITLLSLYYLTAVKRLKGIYLKLINIRKLFKLKTKLPEWAKDVTILSIVVAGSFLIIIGLFYNGYGWWAISYNELSMRLRDPDEPLNLRYMLIGLAGLMALVFTGWRAYIADQNRILGKSRRFDERFDNAAASLAKELNESTFPAHLGAISGLQALATDSPEHTQRCLDIICSCNQWMEGYIDKFIEKKSKGIYSSWLLKEQDRITKEDNQNNIGNITLLHEKRSQESLAAISHILAEISVKRPEQLKELNFHNKMLCGISLNNLKLDDINLENTYLVASDLNNISLNNVKLDRAKLQGTSLDHATLQGVSLDHANLQGVSLYRTNLQGSSLYYTNLQGSSLYYTNLQGSSLYRTNLQGSSLWHANLQGASLWHANLQGASLDHANLQGASLNNASLQGASLRGTNLQWTYLYNANLQGASLYNANLQEALLINTQLQGATINNVNFSYALLLDCNLYGVALEETKIENIIFNNIVDIDYIDKDKRIEWLDDICQGMRPVFVKTFTEKMERAWQAMNNLQEPEGLKAIRKNSIVTQDNMGMYDISEKNLANIHEIWQNLVNEKGIELLLNMRGAILSLSPPSRRYMSGSIKTLKIKRSISENKNTNLVNKLSALIDKLIENNKNIKNK